MAVQKRNSELVSLLSADFVHRLDTLWKSGPQVKKSVDVGDTLIILSGYQYIVVDTFTVNGDVDIMGDLVIL